MGKRILFCVLATFALITDAAIVAGIDSAWLKVAFIALTATLFIEGIVGGITGSPYRVLIFVGALSNFTFLWVVWSQHPFLNIGVMLLFAGHWGGLFTKDKEGS